MSEFKEYVNLIDWTLLTLYFIPQGTVDNNLGPDRLAGPKALDPNDYRQPSLWLHDLCLEVLTVHSIEGSKAPGKQIWYKFYDFKYS